MNRKGYTRKEQAEFSRMKERKIRNDVITKLGGHCTVCGFSDFRALHIDHIKSGNGGKERKKKGWNFMKSLNKMSVEKLNKKFQCLCANHHAIKCYNEKHKPIVTKKAFQRKLIKSIPKMSQRIQRKRTKGFVMPPNSIYVGRGSKWGNPFKLEGDMIYVDAGHRRKILDKWVVYYDGGGYDTSDVVKLFRDLLMDLNSHEVEPEIRERFKYMRDRIKDLQGKKLACWCSLKNCCHADALIELANS